MTTQYLESASASATRQSNHDADTSRLLDVMKQVLTPKRSAVIDSWRGPITALTLVALFRKYANSNRSQIVALAGFDPIRIQSGTSIHGKSRISKRGNREVPRRLYEAPLSATRHNPSVRAIYRRLKESWKPEKVARTAAARKLLIIAHASTNPVNPFDRQIKRRLDIQYSL